LAVPLLAIHGMVNPTFPATDHFGSLPLRTGGAIYALEMAQRFALLFTAVAIWRGVPSLTLISLVTQSKLPPAVGVVFVYAVVLVEVLKRRLANIQLAMRSRGVLDSSGLRNKLHALVALTVPLIATTLMEAVTRSETRSRLGPINLARLTKIAALSKPTLRDVATTLALVTTFLTMLGYAW
jgi:hypothetical protein